MSECSTSSVGVIEQMESFIKKNYSNIHGYAVMTRSEGLAIVVNSYKNSMGNAGWKDFDFSDDSWSAQEDDVDYSDRKSVIDETSEDSNATILSTDDSHDSDLQFVVDEDLTLNEVSNNDRDAPSTSSKFHYRAEQSIANQSSLESSQEIIIISDTEPEAEIDPMTVIKDDNGRFYCSQCKIFRHSSRKRVEIHVRKGHSRARRTLNVRKEMKRKARQIPSSSSSEDDVSVNKTKRKSSAKKRRQLKLQKLVDKIIYKAKRKIRPTKMYSCPICKEIIKLSRPDITDHILKKHRRDWMKRFRAADDSARVKKKLSTKTPEAEKKWLSDSIERSKVNGASGKYYKCWKCSKVCQTYSMTRNHFTSGACQFQENCD